MHLACPDILPSPARLRTESPLFWVGAPRTTSATSSTAPGVPGRPDRGASASPAARPAAAVAGVDCRGRSSAAEAGGEQSLTEFGSLAAVRLRLEEEVGHLVVARALGIGDVLLQPQRVAQAGFGVPDEVVVLVFGAGHVTGFATRLSHDDSFASGVSRR